LFPPGERVRTVVGGCAVQGSEEVVEAAPGGPGPTRVVYIAGDMPLAAQVGDVSGLGQGLGNGHRGSGQVARVPLRRVVEVQDAHADAVRILTGQERGPGGATAG